MNDQQTVISHPEGPRLTLAPYITGFILSLLLTFGAYTLVRVHVSHHHQTPSDTVMEIVLPLMALLQFFIQIYFFLHLGRETKPRWRLLIFGYMVAVVIILVVGSIWIMYNLRYNMNARLTPQMIDKYMQQQENGGL